MHQYIIQNSTGHQARHCTNFTLWTHHINYFITHNPIKIRTVIIDEFIKTIFLVLLDHEYSIPKIDGFDEYIKATLEKMKIVFDSTKEFTQNNGIIKIIEYYNDQQWEILEQFAFHTALFLSKKLLTEQILLNLNLPAQPPFERDMQILKEFVANHRPILKNLIHLLNLNAIIDPDDQKTLNEFCVCIYQPMQKIVLDTGQKQVNTIYKIISKAEFDKRLDNVLKPDQTITQAMKLLIIQELPEYNTEELIDIKRYCSLRAVDTTIHTKIKRESNRIYKAYANITQYPTSIVDYYKNNLWTLFQHLQSQGLLKIIDPNQKIHRMLNPPQLGRSLWIGLWTLVIIIGLLRIVVGERKHFTIVCA